MFCVYRGGKIYAVRVAKRSVYLQDKQNKHGTSQHNNASTCVQKANTRTNHPNLPPQASAAATTPKKGNHTILLMQIDVNVTSRTYRDFESEEKAFNSMRQETLPQALLHASLTPSPTHTHNLTQT